MRSIFIACARSQAGSKTCIYSEDAVTVVQQRTHRPLAARVSTIQSRRPAPHPPSVTPSSLLEVPPATKIVWTAAAAISEHQTSDQDEDSDQGLAYYTARGRFAGDVAAAIDEKAGSAAAGILRLVPCVDAPLLGELDLHPPASSPRTHSALDVDYQLPPRGHADRLVGIYWEYVNPMEPTLDRDRFLRDYNATYSASGTVPHADCDVWLSTLDVIFALAVQRQESTSQQEREKEGTRYPACVCTPASLDSFL